MDTATHFAYGIGLAGLAHIDPNVTADVWTTAAVSVGTILGSQAPDADTLYRFHSNEKYVRNHRGLSHSVPAWFVWTLAISAGICLAFPGVNFFTVACWVMIAVLVHVATDLFNAYGTQAFRPFTKRWIRWNVIHIFDPFTFGAHVAAIVLWISGLVQPQTVFPVLYGILALYFVWRTLVHRRVERSCPSLDKTGLPGDSYTALPTVHWNVWNIVRRRGENQYAVGTWSKDAGLIWNGLLVSRTSPEIEASREHPAVASFLSFCPFPCADAERQGTDVIVRWVDVRYQYRKQFPFVAVVKYNGNMEPVFSFVGWISDEKLERRIETAANADLF